MLDMVETILELGSEYGFITIIVVIYLIDKFNDTQFYKKTIDQNFKEIDHTLENLQKQISLVLSAVIVSKTGDKETADELLSVAAKEGKGGSDIG